jgi:hypothetical protein
LAKTFAVHVKNAAVGQACGQAGPSKFRNRIDIASNQRPTLEIQRFEKWRVWEALPRRLVNGKDLESGKLSRKRDGNLAGDVLVEQ